MSDPIRCPAGTTCPTPSSDVTAPDGGPENRENPDWSGGTSSNTPSLRLDAPEPDVSKADMETSGSTPADKALKDKSEVKNDVTYGFRTRRNHQIQGYARPPDDVSGLDWTRIKYVQDKLIQFFDNHSGSIKRALADSARFSDVPSMLQRHALRDISYYDYVVSFRPKEGHVMSYEIYMKDSDNDGAVDEMHVLEDTIHYTVKRRWFKKVKEEHGEIKSIYKLSGVDFQPFFSALLAVGLAK